MPIKGAVQLAHFTIAGPAIRYISLPTVGRIPLLSGLMELYITFLQTTLLTVSYITLHLQNFKNLKGAVIHHKSQ